MYVLYLAIHDEAGIAISMLLYHSHELVCSLQLCSVEMGSKGSIVSTSCKAIKLQKWGQRAQGNAKRQKVKLQRQTVKLN